MPTSPVTPSRPRVPALRRAAVLLATVLAAGAAQAATWTVTSVGDGATTAPCSAGNQCANLRDAIAAAAAGDTIQFSANGTISLVARLNVSRNLTIQGPGAAQLTLSGQGTVRILTISAAASLTLSGVTLADGFVQPGSGGAAFVDEGATLTLADSVVRNNTAGNGGGLAAQVGRLTVTGTTFDSNSAGALGGAVSLTGGGALATGTFVANTFSGNTAYDGGAINANDGSLLTAVNNSFVGNQAVVGGALMVVDQASIRNNTFSGNGASVAAAIQAFVPITAMDNNVFTGNASTRGAGALRGSIAGSHNVFFNNTNAGTADDATGYGTTNPVIATAAPLGALGNHGGPTQTMLPQGEALCAGEASLLPAGTTTDQRGLPRTSPVPVVPCLDAGAVQLNRTGLNVMVTGSGSVNGAASPAPLWGGITACDDQIGTACQAGYNGEVPDSVTLTATPPAGGSVTWGGACAGATGNTCTVSMSEGRAVSARFAAAPPVPVALSVAVTGTGSVSAGATPAPLAGAISACTSQGGAACQADYDSALAASVILTATPPAGGSVTWGGACAGATGNTCTVSMGQARAVSAAFPAAPPVPVPVPTLGQWGLLLLGALAAAIGGLTLRRRGT